MCADEIVGDSPEPSFADVQIDGNQVENALRLALSGEIEQEAEDERQSAALVPQSASFGYLRAK